MTTVRGELVGVPSMTMQINIALDQLDKHKLNDAEETLRNVLQDVTTTTKDRDQHIIRSLVGLGDVNSKRAMHARINILEWHWRYLQALAFYYKAVQHCDEKLSSDTFDNKLYHWLQEEKAKILQSAKVIEEMVIKSVQKQMLGKSSEMRHTKNMALDRVVEVNWLQTLCKYCRDRQKQQGEQASDTSDTEAEKEAVPDEAKEKEDLMEKEKVKKNKVDFNKIQKAVQKLARQISFEVRQRQKLGLSPHDIDHLIDLDAIQEDSDDESQSTEIAISDVDRVSRSHSGTPDRHSSPRRTKESPLPKESDSEWVWTEDRNESVVKYTVRGDRSTLPFTVEQPAVPLARSPILPSERKRSTDDRLPVVITVWEAYRAQQPPPILDQEHSHELQTFEELSPVTEVFKFPGEAGNTDSKKLDEPVTEQTVVFAFAKVLCLMAFKWRREKRLKAGHEVLKYALGLLQSISNDEPVQGQMAEALKYLGSIKCKLGDMPGGTKLMEQAIQLFEETQNSSAAFNIASVWFELGNAYIGEQLDDGALFDLMMKSVREELEQEFKKEGEQYSDDDNEGYDSEEEEEENYFLGIHEAVDCFQESMSILSELPRAEKESNLYADVQTKLGDCSIVVGNYDRAVTCYEAAMRLCKNSVGSESLPNNAHALSMMGMMNYFLGNHPKAVQMFETAHLIQQHLHGQSGSNFAMAFNLTMMGISNYLMKQHHRCIVWCLKAFELYTNIYSNNISELEEQKLWFVTQTLFYLGFSYSAVNLNEKALYYLRLSKYLITKSTRQKCAKQLVKILKSMADVHAATDDHETALKLYNEAYQQSMSIDDESSTIALQNQLLNRMAGAHVSSRNYNEAAAYLEQALDHQKNLETDIKGDLVMVLYQLGTTYILAGDIDRALECFNECLDSYQEMRESEGPDLAQTMCSLATLYHVKSCMVEDPEDMIQYEELAESYYKQAMELEQLGAVAVKYANFLYQQGLYGEALEVLLPLVLPSSNPDDKEVCYLGVEQAILPEQLQHEVDEFDEAMFETKILSQFLSVVCYHHLQLMSDAENTLVDLLHTVMASKTGLNMSILGFAMMELELYIEAALTFSEAAELQEDKSSPLQNMRLSVVTWVYATWVKGIQIYMEYLQSLSTKALLVKAQQEAKERRALEASQQLRQTESPPLRKHTRDSGYYDHRLDESMERYKAKLEEDQEEVLEEWETTETVVTTPPAILERLKAKYWSSDPDVSLSDKGYTSNETLVPSDLGSQEDILHSIQKQSGTPVEVLQAAWAAHRRDMRATMASESMENLHKFTSLSTIPNESFGSQQDLQLHAEQWHTEEETVETPAVILQNRSWRSNSDSNHMVQSESMQDLREQSTSSYQPAYMSQSQSMKELRVNHDDQTLYENSNLSDSPEDEEEWIITEESIETPAAILQALNTSSHTLTPPGSPTSLNEGSVFHSTPEKCDNTSFSFTSSGTPDQSMQDETWVSEEVVVETPMELIEALAKQGQDAADEAYSALEPSERRKIVDNTTTTISSSQSSRHDIPGAYNQYSKASGVSDSDSKFGQGQSQYATYTTYSQYTASPAVEKGNKAHKQLSDFNQSQNDSGTWEVFEETVETPVEVLNMLKSQRLSEQSESSLPESTSNGRYTTHSSFTTIKPEDEEEQVWETEETVTTPSEIIEMIKRQQQGTETSRFQYGEESSHAVDSGRWNTGTSKPLQSQSHKYEYTSSYGDNKYGQWTETETKSSPARVQILNQNNQHYNELGNKNQTEESTETWETIEETVETPQAILQALMAAQQFH